MPKLGGRGGRGGKDGCGVCVGVFWSVSPTSIIVCQGEWTQSMIWGDYILGHVRMDFNQCKNDTLHNLRKFLIIICHIRITLWYTCARVNIF